LSYYQQAKFQRATHADTSYIWSSLLLSSLVLQ